MPGSPKSRRRSPISASSRCARISRSSPRSGRSFPATSNISRGAGLISTGNFAGFASSHNFALGKPEANHWGQAVSLLETTAAGPYYFNFHQGDLGNFTVIGPSGSGKTVVLNFLLAQARKFHPRIIFFDKDRGAELFIRAIGGRYDVLRPDTAAGLNPLQLEDNPANRQFLIDWVAQLAGGADIDEAAKIKDAIDANFDQPLEHRRLRHLAELFRGGVAADRGRPLFAAAPVVGRRRARLAVRQRARPDRPDRRLRSGST